MKHPQNPRRGRGRGGQGTGSGSGKRHQPSKNRNFESSGGETKVRGNAQQVLDKYQAMARDASAAGEHIQAEGYWQHAEHYYRILNADRDDRPVNKNNDVNAKQNGGDENTANSGNTPRVEPSSSREIPIETPASDNSGERVERVQAEPVQTVVQPQPDVSSQPIVQDQQEQQAQPVEQNQSAVQGQPEAEKPKRRGRPRKAKTEGSPEASNKDAESEIVSV